MKTALAEVAYQELVRFYDEQVAAGCWHPSFTESIADFTPDAAAALVYYRRALNEARLLGEQTHSILICMAKRLFELGQTEPAETCLREGRAEAVRRGHGHSIEVADRVSHETSGGHPSAAHSE